MRWREKLAEVAGLPPLTLMEGFYKQGEPCTDPVWEAKYAPEDKFRKWRDIQGGLPIKWNALKPDVLYELLYHSDCEGELDVKILLPLAKRLEELIPLLPDGDGGGNIGIWKEKTKQFAKGLRAAAKKKQRVTFR